MDNKYLPILTANQIYHFVQTFYLLEFNLISQFYSQFSCH